MNTLKQQAWLAVYYAALPAKRLVTFFKKYQCITRLQNLHKQQLLTCFTQKQVERLHCVKKMLVQKDIVYLQQHPDVQLLTFIDQCYPQLLLEIADPPPLLFVRGNVDLLQQKQIAIVGSRHATCQGKEIAASFARELTNENLIVCSGMAKGIDAAAHLSALQVGQTVAVLGGGFAQIYPRQHQGLAEKIVGQGALVTEHPPFVPPRAHHFPKRNRIISGLSLGIVVVEATLRSGSLITAKLALDQGRDVFAVPGHIYNDKVQGCHALIREGAKLIVSSADILHELCQFKSENEQNKTAAAKKTTNYPQDLDKNHQQVFNCIDNCPTAIDLIADRSGVQGKALSAVLLSLEMRGMVQQVAGGFQRTR